MRGPTSLSVRSRHSLATRTTTEFNGLPPNLLVCIGACFCTCAVETVAPPPPVLLLVTLVTMGKEVVMVFALAGMISTLVLLAETTVGTPALVMLLMLMGKLLTADNGMAFKPLIWIGMAPCGKVLPAKIMFLEVLLPGKKTVEVGAATLLMVVFLGSEAKDWTATGMAVAYSIPPVFNVTVSSVE